MKWFLGMSVALLLLILCIPWMVVGCAPFSWATADRNTDGWVSWDEAFSVMDYGVRPIQVANRTCDEYFFLKDGRPLTVICPS